MDERHDSYQQPYRDNQQAYGNPPVAGQDQFPSAYDPQAYVHLMQSQVASNRQFCIHFSPSEVRPEVDKAVEPAVACDRSNVQKPFT